MPKPTFEVKLVKKEEVAFDTLAFSFSRPPDFSYEPGQHIEVMLIDPVETDELGNKRDFSLASAPYEQELLVVARIRESAFKRTLSQLSEGTPVMIAGPLGSSFRLHTDTTRPAVFIAGGIGIAAFLGMVKHVLHEKLPYKMVLLYSNRRPEDTAYLSYLQDLASAYVQFKCMLTMTRMKQSTAPWSGAEGYISKEMILSNIENEHTAVFYIAGPPAMVQSIDSLLLSMGIPRENIRTEEFEGY